MDRHNHSSEDNVELVRALFERWSAGDMDGLRQLYDSSVIVRAPEGWPEPGPFVGADAVMRQWEQMRDSWDAETLEPTSDFIGSADRVVCRFTWRAVGHGPQTDMEMTGVWTVRKGKVYEAEFFWDHMDALQTVGLTAYDGDPD